MAERKAFLLRIDPELWAELEAWAQGELRSVNGQIEFLLREAVIQRRRGRSRRAPSSRSGEEGEGRPKEPPSAAGVG